MRARMSVGWQTAITNVGLIVIWAALAGALVSLWFILKRGAVSSDLKRTERPIEYWYTVAAMAVMASCVVAIALAKTFP
jgi:hypothetical protein